MSKQPPEQSGTGDYVQSLDYEPPEDDEAEADGIVYQDPIHVLYWMLLVSYISPSAFDMGHLLPLQDRKRVCYDAKLSRTPETYSCFPSHQKSLHTHAPMASGNGEWGGSSL